MTTFEDIARQKLNLVTEGPRYSTVERIGYLAGLIGAVCFIYVVAWPIVCILFSLG